MASYRFRRRISTLFLGAAAALTPAIPPRAATRPQAAVASPPCSKQHGRGPHRRPAAELGRPRNE